MLTESLETRVRRLQSTVAKFNPHHDPRGRFTTSGSFATAFSQRMAPNFLAEHKTADWLQHVSPRPGVVRVQQISQQTGVPLNEASVQKWQRAIQQGNTIPALAVAPSSIPGRFGLVDGHHRLAALQREGRAGGNLQVVVLRPKAGYKWIRALDESTRTTSFELVKQ